MNKIKLGIETKIGDTTLTPIVQTEIQKHSTVNSFAFRWSKTPIAILARNSQGTQIFKINEKSLSEEQEMKIKELLISD